MSSSSSTTIKSNNWVPIPERYRAQPRPLKIITIGAGFSGLIMAHKIQNQYKLDQTIEHIIYEKNPDIGGTWYENKYPGVGCDIPAHVYTFSWEPNPDWTAFYVTGAEIFDYIKQTANKYNLTKNIQLNSKVIRAEWNENDGKWFVDIEQNGKMIQDVCDILVNACGLLNRWKWPDINGLKDFQGHIVHTAQWIDDYDFQGKQVGLIGNGASRIQILPQIQRLADHVTCFIRNPTWVTPPCLGQHAGPEGKNFKYTEEQKTEFRSNPEKLLEMRKKLEHDLNKNFALFIKDSLDQIKAQKVIKNFMLKYFGDNQELATKLIPSWGVGCRRPTPNNHYLEAIVSKNVTVTMSRIDRITKTGIQTVDNQHYNLDAIICATGFDLSYCPPWKLIGRNGVELADVWKTDPEGYFGIAVHSFPNYFVFFGPNAPIGHGSVIGCLELSADYILKWARKIQEEDIHSIDVKKEVVDDYNTFTQEFMERTVWKSGCRSWYTNRKLNGKVTAKYPGSFLHYKEMLDVLRGEDFSIKYNTANRFSFMGNGFTKREILGEELAYYLEK